MASKQAFRIALGFFLAIFTAIAEPPDFLPPLHLEGRIGRTLEIAMDLGFSWGQDANGTWRASADGRYSYEKYHRDIRVSGQRVGDNVTLNESDPDRKPTGQFVGKLVTGKRFKGQWTSADGSRTLPFDLSVKPLRVGPAPKGYKTKPEDAGEIAAGCIIHPSARPDKALEGILDLSGGMDCDYRINEALPIFHFHAPSNGAYGLKQIEVTKGRDKRVIQTLGTPEDGTYGHSCPVLEVIDMNFDGYLDLRSAIDCPPSGNTSYDVWLFDPAKNLFVNWPDLAVSGAEFDPVNHTVSWHWHMSSRERTGGTARVDKDGTVTKIREIETGFTEDGQHTFEVVRELRNGKMVEVSRILDPDP